MRSDNVTKGSERAPNRSLFYALGYTPEELDRPLIGVVSAYSEIVPGHMNLDKIADAVKAGVQMAGGTPILIPAIGVCDGIAMGHVGMKYSLASRELICDSVETMLMAHQLDGLVLVPNCDKIVPGMVMAAVRMDVPAVVCSGGPMLAGTYGGEEVSLSKMFEAVGAYKAGMITDEQLEDCTCNCCPSCGSCSGMYTANSMNCLCEAIGIALPGNGTIPAVYSKRLLLAKHAGMAIMDLVSRGVTARQIINERSIRNALTCDMALGYSNFSIAGKYLFYAMLATILGSIVGMVVGFVVFPIIIWNAYQLVFSLPTFTLYFYPGMAAASVGISAAVIGFATWYACRSSLAEKTAALLLPRAPVAGKRILMERITPLWSRMSFSQKTTARNLFRYKKRFFMTVLGVAGCTALLLIGFGIQDSLLPIVTKQSTELTHNDMSITLSDPKALTMEQGLAEELDSNSAVQNWGAVYTKSTTIYNAEGESASVSIVATAKDSDLTRYVTFRTRKGHKAISFDSGSAILTEKTAENLGLHTGDTFWVENTEGARVELTLTGITENYMFTRLYLPRAQLESLLGTEDIPWNTVYGQTTCTDAAGYNALRTDLLDCNYVSGISFTEDTTELFDNLIVSLGYVVVLIIICAAALAAVVLYNLISVNLGERKKELATIKVLGFYDQEVYRYIFREIELLALIGSGVGLALGVPLHKFIVLTVEMDQLMFIRTIAPRSYLLAVALTMVFTVVVCFVMRRHVRRISMVESMKAPE